MKRVWLCLLGAVLLTGAAGCAETPSRTESSVPTTADTVATVTATTTTTTIPIIPSRNEDFTFYATVIEDFLLVEADAGGLIYGEVCVVLQQAVSVKAGDRIRVWHTGQMMPSLPPRIVATEIEMIS